MILNTAAPAKAVTVPVPDEKLTRLLTWVGELIRENGTGEYILTVAADGHVTVKRPRKPLEFHYAG